MKQTDVKTRLIIKMFTCMALLSFQLIKISILLIDTVHFIIHMLLLSNTLFITLMNDILKGKANG